MLNGSIFSHRSRRDVLFFLWFSPFVSLLGCNCIGYAQQAAAPHFLLGPRGSGGARALCLVPRAPGAVPSVKVRVLHCVSTLHPCKGPPSYTLLFHPLLVMLLILIRTSGYTRTHTRARYLLYSFIRGCLTISSPVLPLDTRMGYFSIRAENKIVSRE